MDIGLYKYELVWLKELFDLKECVKVSVIVKVVGFYLVDVDYFEYFGIFKILLGFLFLFDLDS